MRRLKIEVKSSEVKKWSQEVEARQEWSQVKNEVKKSRWIEEMKREWIKEWRSQEAKNEEPQEAKNQEELQEPQEPHNKINFKYFTIFNTSLFYKPFSTTSKSI